MAAGTLDIPRVRRPMVSGWSDDALVAGVRGGDDAAFEAVYDRYHRNLLAFCRHMLGSREEAEDALQHSFMAAYRALRGGAPVVGLKPWLYTIARNRCRSVLRARRDEMALDDGAAATEGLAAEVARRADLRLLVRDVQRLAPDQRAALVLFELGDHSHEEIAAVLGVRREKVKALVFQAREALMGWRAAREPCAQVREQLATLTGSALRRTPIRRHVEQCATCAAYEAEVGHQRAALAIALPVAPAAGLKAGVLGLALGGSGIGTAAAAGAVTSGAGGLAALGVNGIAAKVLVVVAIAGGAGATGYVAVEQVQRPRAVPATRVQKAAPAVPAARVSAAAAGTTIAATPPVSPAVATSVAKRGGANANANARGGRGRTLATKGPHGKAAAPGQVKASGSPAQGEALGASKVNARRAAPAHAKPPAGRVGSKSPKPTTVRRSVAESPSSGLPAVQTTPGEHPTGPQGQARKQDDPSAKNP